MDYLPDNNSLVEGHEPQDNPPPEKTYPETVYPDQYSFNKFGIHAQNDHYLKFVFPNIF